MACMSSFACSNYVAPRAAHGRENLGLGGHDQEHAQLTLARSQTNADVPALHSQRNHVAISKNSQSVTNEATHVQDASTLNRTSQPTGFCTFHPHRQQQEQQQQLYGHPDHWNDQQQHHSHSFNRFEWHRNSKEIIPPLTGNQSEHFYSFSHSDYAYKQSQYINSNLNSKSRSSDADAILSSSNSISTNISTPLAKSRRSHAITNLSESFAPLKSPMSQFVDAIIGAAEIVNRNDRAQHDHKQQQGQHQCSSNEQQSEHKQADTRKLTKSRTNDEHDTDQHSKTTTIMEQVDEIEATLQDPKFYRILTLTMALERPRKTEKPSKLPPNVIGEGFYWKEYPELEDMLYCKMHQYYKYSANSRQSKHQQAYNNALVKTVKQVAAKHGYEFDSKVYNDKKLRDRIRCFYKTHLQNAKKRLHTLQKHIVGPEQRRALNTLIQRAKSHPPSLVAQISYSSDDDDEEGDGIEHDYVHREDGSPFRKRRYRHSSTSE